MWPFCCTYASQNSATIESAQRWAGCGPQDTFLSSRPSRSPTWRPVRISLKIHGSIHRGAVKAMPANIATNHVASEISSRLPCPSGVPCAAPLRRPSPAWTGSLRSQSVVLAVERSRARYGPVSTSVRFHLQQPPDNHQPPPSTGSDRSRGFT